MGLNAAKPLLQLLEMLNKILQGRTMNVNGMKKSVNLVKNELQQLRSEEAFHEIFIKSEKMCETLGLDLPALPRQRKAPKRYDSGGAQQHVSSSVEEYYRVQFFTAIDVAILNLNTRFKSTDLTKFELPM